MSEFFFLLTETEIQDGSPDSDQKVASLRRSKRNVGELRRLPAGHQH